MFRKFTILFTRFSILAISLVACDNTASLTPIAQAAVTEGGTAVNAEAEDVYLPTVPAKARPSTVKTLNTAAARPAIRTTATAPSVTMPAR